MNYYGQFDPPVDKILHTRYFPELYDGVSIECGSFDGKTENCTKFFEDNYNWNTINIEPLPHVFDLLKQNRPNSINLELGLSNFTADKEITVYNINKYGIYNTNASIAHTPKHRKLLEGISKNKETFSIHCTTYRELIKELGLNRLDLFILDVEGHEPEVIDGMAGCDILPDVFVIEHGHRDPAFFVEKIKVLGSRYRLDHVFEVNSFFVKEK